MGGRDGRKLRWGEGMVESKDGGKGWKKVKMGGRGGGKLRWGEGMEES